ncbi:MAG: phospho-N-acetylmuramoyl-pentapeptide-transferase [Phycisphaerales bacterium]|jgi:phospho-N-acetylmuramoyl-pentapeptide-transferase
MFYYLTNAFEGWLGNSVYWVIQIFTQFHFRAFAALIFSFFFVIVFGPKTIARLRALKVGDNPEFYNADLNTLNQGKRDTPTMGGILICGAILSSVFLFTDLSSRYVHLAMLIMVWLAGVGMFDDWLKLTAARRAAGTREGLFAWEKLLFQLGGALLVAFFLFSVSASETDPSAISLNLPFQRTFENQSFDQIRASATAELNPNVILLPLWAFLIIGTLFIAGTSNAVNIADGMDGLAAGTMSIASVVVMVLCFVASNREWSLLLMVPYVPGARELIVISGAMVGACLGFLWFNCNPARVFMGDTGSLALGGLLAFVAFAIRQELLLILIAGIFYLELASTMLQVGYFKWSGGKRIFRCAPIHHHFHLGGWSESQVVVRFWVITAMLGAIALAVIKVR